jgi:hypothetical protein
MHILCALNSPVVNFEDFDEPIWRDVDAGNSQPDLARDIGCKADAVFDPNGINGTSVLAPYCTNPVLKGCIVNAEGDPVIDQCTAIRPVHIAGIYCLHAFDRLEPVSLHLTLYLAAARNIKHAGLRDELDLRYFPLRHAMQALGRARKPSLWKDARQGQRAGWKLSQQAAYRMFSQLELVPIEQRTSVAPLVLSISVQQ